MVELDGKRLDRDEIAQRVLTCTLKVEDHDDGWVVGHQIGIPGVVVFRIAGAALDPKHGKVVTLLRDDWPSA